jgi:hypothetical protein
VLVKVGLYVLALIAWAAFSAVGFMIGGAENGLGPGIGVGFVAALLIYQKATYPNEKWWGR